MERRTFLKIATLGSACTTLPALSTIKQDGGNLTEDYLNKIRNPNEFYEGDITSDQHKRRLVRKLAQRLGRVKKIVGHGNFSVLSFDDMLRYAKVYSKIGSFNKEEIAFLDELFHEDAVQYGFYGEKPLDDLTATIKRREIEKIPRTS